MGPTELTFTDLATDEPAGGTIELTASHDNQEIGSATITVTDSRPAYFTEVEATVLGDAVEGRTVEFSRAIAGRQRDYAWSAVTDADDQAALTISSATRSGVSGFYQARARNADGGGGQWYSISLNRGRRQVLELTLGGGMRVVRSERLDAAKQVAEQGKPGAGGLEPNAPNPFNKQHANSLPPGQPRSGAPGDLQRPRPAGAHPR